MMSGWRQTLLAVLTLAAAAGSATGENPYQSQINRQVKRLSAGKPSVRCSALRNLALMRAYGAADRVVGALVDSDAGVRRHAAMALGRTGSRKHLKVLLKAMDDKDWTVRQSAGISLTNLTGQTFPFDALAAAAKRTQQLETWSKWLGSFRPDQLSKDFAALLTEKGAWIDKERLARALGAIGDRRSATPHLVGALKTYVKLRSSDRTERLFVQASIRSLGRLGAPKATDTLIALLDNPTWAVYAADALGDIGGDNAAAALIGALPDYAYILDRPYRLPAMPHGNGHTLVRKRDPADIDNGGGGKIWTPRTAYSILFALSRIEFTTPEMVKSLQTITPHIVANMPQDFDGTVAYEVEPWERISGALLEKAGVRQDVVDVAFNALGLDRAIPEALRSGPENLARNAKLTASSEYSASYAARFAADGIIPTPGSPNSANAEWAAKGNDHPNGVVLTLAWLKPVTIAEIVYYGRTASAVECWKDYEVYLDAATKPVLKGRFKAGYGPQRMKIATPGQARKVRIKFLSSHFGLNPGAAEIQVYAKPPGDAVLGKFVPLPPYRSDGELNAGKIPNIPASAKPKPDWREQLIKATRGLADRTENTLTPFAVKVILCACRAKEDIPLVVKLLSHKSHWVRISAAKTLMSMNARSAAGAIRGLLEAAKDDADFGYFGNYGRADWKPLLREYGRHSSWYIGHDEFNDPTPRYKEAFLRALGRLGDDKCAAVLAKYLDNQRNAMEIQYAAANALAELGGASALAALKRAEASHPFHNVRLVAREALYQRGEICLPRTSRAKPSFVRPKTALTGKTSQALVFIKGPLKPPNAWFFSPTLQAYNQTDEGPTYRVGLNIYKLDRPDPKGKVTQLTHFKDGFVADLRVSYDGRRILFSRRGGAKDPWWHVFEMSADGSGLRQITRGPYHDVQANFLPDGRLVFSTSRQGGRDEYHGYPSTGLAVMNADGSDIHCIGFNCGRDLEPVVNTDGRILFVRLEDFYSLPKLEFLLEACLPDGTRAEVLYGPERRAFWAKNIARKGSVGPQSGRHRTVCVSQPQPLDGKRFLINSFSGPMIIGPGRNKERILQADDSMAITTPFPINATTLLCAAGRRPSRGRGKYDFWKSVNHGLYWMDIKTGKLTLIYDDPKTSEFEARPLKPRPVPPVRAAVSTTRQDAYTGRLYCASIFNTQEADVKVRGRYVRIVEGIPMVARHSTHSNAGIAWMNHGGAMGRILGVLPVAPDGSFSVELPADRLFHIQVLDADGYVVGNELNWQYVRPSETKGCVGCHEKSDTSARHRPFASALKTPPLRCLPVGGEMRYRAKNWFKWFNDENEERKRTVNSINIMGRL